MDKIEITPGTVSKILWHFTGGPKWNERLKRQNIKPKPASEAFENLLSILKSRELRLGNYKEIMRVVIPEFIRINPKTNEEEIIKNHAIEINSSPVCCVADIPIAHLSYNSSRYGKFAIGFYRDKLVNKGFNPVLYSLDNSQLINSIYLGFNNAQYIDADYLTWILGEINYKIQEKFDIEAGIEIDLEFDDILDSIDRIKYKFEMIKKAFANYLSFIKTFRKDEFNTIYCEREWRSIYKFNFELSDVAMIVIPHKIGNSKYFEKLVTGKYSKLIPRNIPIVPWEDLIEH